MDENTKDKGSGWRPAGCATTIGVLVLVVVYVLSVGPVFRLTMQGNFNYEVFYWLYKPLHWLINAVGLESVYLAYLDWWLAY